MITFFKRAYSPTSSDKFTASYIFLHFLFVGGLILDPLPFLDYLLHIDEQLKTVNSPGDNCSRFCPRNLSPLILVLSVHSFFQVLLFSFIKDLLQKPSGSGDKCPSVIVFNLPVSIDFS